jgi:two-component sensor histidine kinase
MSDIDDRAAAEARHRLANVLQLLTTLTRMRMQRAQDEESRRQLGGALNLTGAVGLIQQRLLKSRAPDLGAFLEEMAAHWRRSCGKRPLAIELDVEAVEVREQSFSALALIAHELVSNAIAHAFPDERGGTVRVALRRHDGERARLIVADDGQGFDAASAETGRLGLWLARNLCAQAQTRLEITTTGGTASLDFAAPPLGDAA